MKIGHFNFNFFQQMFYVAKAPRQPTNVLCSVSETAVIEVSYLYRW